MKEKYEVKRLPFFLAMVISEARVRVRATRGPRHYATVARRGNDYVGHDGQPTNRGKIV